MINGFLVQSSAYSLIRDSFRPDGTLCLKITEDVLFVLNELYNFGLDLK